MESTLRRTWAEIDLDALAHNYRRLRRHIGPDVRFLGVVKADAYGHGAVQVARTLQDLGADRMTGGAEAYTYLGTANYVKHTGSRPMNITWQLDRPIPAKFLKKTNKLVVG